MIKRRNHGRGHSYYADRMPGHPADELVKLPGVTTILDQLPKPALMRWYSRVTADYALDNWLRLTSLAYSQRREELLSAPGKTSGKAAVRGTDVHRLAEQIVTGQAVEVPEHLRGHVESYRKFLDDFDPDPVAMELVIVNRAVGYCGTADLIAHLLGQVWLLDLKTGESGVWPEAALQACGYEHGEVYAFPDDPGEEHPLAGLGIQRAGVVHVRADGYDLRPLDTGPAVWEMFCRLAANHYAADSMKEWVGEAVEPLRAVS